MKGVNQPIVVLRYVLHLKSLLYWNPKFRAKPARCVFYCISITLKKNNARTIGNLVRSCQCSGKRWVSLRSMWICKYISFDVLSDIHF